MGRYDVSNVIDQLLRQDEAGLKAYIVLRLGGAERLQAVYDEVRQRLARESTELSEKAPSLRAAAYALSRRLAHDNAARESTESIVWLATTDGRPPGYTQVLDRIRSTFDAPAAELLELRYARGLEVEEIQFATGLGAPEVSRQLGAAEMSVEKWRTGLGGSSVSVQTLIFDAFRPSLVPEDKQAASPHTTTARLAHGANIGGHFEVRSTLEEGRFAASYLASDTSVPGESVVLQLFHRAARTLAARSGVIRKLHRIDSVANPSVERNLGYGWHEDRLWRATPRYAGHSLLALVEGGALTPAEAIEIFGPIARGLGALHERGIVHGDLSLERISLVRAGDESTLPLLTGMEVWIAGGGAAGPAVDIRALGLALLYSLEPTTRPAGSPDAREVRVPGSKRVKPFASLLKHALSEQPDKRPSAWEFAKELDRIESALGAQSGRKWINALVAVLAVGVVLLGFAFFVRESRSRLIQEARDGADARTLQSELDAERERGRELERQLEEANKKEP